MSAEPYRMIVRAHGGPEVIEREAFDPGAPGPGELLVANEAVGLNLIDTYFRTGLYDAPLPFALGSEAAGTVVAAGPGVTASPLAIASARSARRAPMRATAWFPRIAPS
jgi:NADPH2:quinone reductase